MAFFPQSTRQYFQQHEDPWLWSTVEVTAALCSDDGPLRSSGSQRSFPDPQFLAQTLQENAVSGPSLLTDINHVSLRDELGIKALGHRTSILHCIQDLRRRSVKYLDHVQTNSAPVISPADVGSGSGYIITPGNMHFRPSPHQGLEAERSSIYSTSYVVPGFDPDTYISPTPSIYANGSRLAAHYSSKSLVEPQENVETLENTVHIARKRIEEEPRISKRPYSLEADESSPQPKSTSNSAIQVDVPGTMAVRDVRLAETCVVDESGRKRRRLDLSAHAPTRAASLVIDAVNPIGSSELCGSFAEADVMEDAGSQPENSQECPTTLLAESLKSHGPGTVIIDEQGRKRVIPISVAYMDPKKGRAVSAPLSGDLTSGFTDGQCQTPSVRKPHQVYLGLKSLAIDTIFYSDTLLGQEVKNDVTVGKIWRANSLEESDPESLWFSGQLFGNGLRRYVGARIRHYLSNGCLRVHNQEKQVIIIPYPDTLVKKHHQLSATVFSKSPAGLTSLRMERSECLQNNFPSGRGSTDNLFDISNPSFPQAETTSMDWDYLQKWGRRGVEDEVLPVYGESGSEGEYDLQTWQEIEGEKQKVKATMGRPKKKFLSQAEVEENVKVAEKQMIEQWEAVRKPQLRRRAWLLWKKSRYGHSKHFQISSYKRSLEQLENRLFKIRSEIMGTQWTSTKQLQKQCSSMEVSIFDREKYLWLMYVLQKKTPPPKMPPLPRTKSKVITKDMSSSKGSSDSSDLDDFIADDDIPSQDESVLATCRVTEDDDDTHMMSDGESGILPQTPDVKIASENDERISQSRSSIPWDNHPTPLSRNIFKNQPDIIDLTQRSDTVSEATSPAKPPSSGIVSELPYYHGDPFGPAPKKTAIFKKPPGASPTIVIDSDPMEAPVEDDLDLTGIDEVKNISNRNANKFVILKDRKRLLVWTIARTQIVLRASIIHYVENASLKEVRSTVWTGLKVFKRNKARKLPGLDEQDSESRLLLASWYVCWTIPVTLNTGGLKDENVRITMESESGFPVFFDYLKRVLAFFKSPSVDRSIKRQKRNRVLALQEDQSDDPLSSPHRKRKYAVPESDWTMSQRADARLRVQETEKRRELQKRRLNEMGVNDEDASKVVVNPGKHDDQSFIYLNPKIADRIQPHQIEGVRFMWREVIADHQGCLLAQTMGLGKTMQVITLLVTIAEAAKSNEGNIRAQVPEDLWKSRTLILCPPALIENWWDEFLMWTPLPLKDNIGELRKVTPALKITERLWEIQAWKEEGGVLLLGFHTFRDMVQNKVKTTGRKMLDDEQHGMVTEALLKWPNLIVADEAHLAKTAGSGINVTLNSIKSMTRIALTGSPLANNLEEYHSLINWIAPGYLGTSVEFKANYVEKIQAGLWQDSTTMEYRNSLKRLEALKQELDPKIHRADITVLQGRLKEKQEFVIRVPLTPIQEEIYQLYIETMSTVIEDPQKRSTPTVWAWLAILRLLCNHPECFRDRLLLGISSNSTAFAASRKRKFVNASMSTDNEVATADEADALVDAPISRIGISQSVLDKQLAPFEKMTVPLDSVSLSNKMQVLMDILRLSREATDKVLIFSHSIHTLNYVEKQLKNTKMIYSRIDGTVPTGSRQQITKDFNYDDTEVCLISTRAGGQGLNLFGANRVVILDDHFNPMHEEQAVGRAYRIGQLKPVFVYHLMAGGTFEEVLHNQSVFKQQLAKRVVDKKNPVRRALRGIGEYLLPPRVVEQKDLSQFEGKDPFVLDQILATHKE